MRGLNAHPSLGPLIWESPTASPAPKPISYVLSGVFLLMGLALSCGVVPMLVNARDAADRNGGIAGGIVILALVGCAAWIFLRARHPQKLLGVQFFQSGLEFGPTSNRRSVPYRELESITFEPLDVASQQLGRKMAGAGLAISLVAGNPAGIGYALGTLNAELVESFAVVKLFREPKFRVAMYDGFGVQVEAAVCFDQAARAA